MAKRTKKRQASPESVEQDAVTQPEAGVAPAAEDEAHDDQPGDPAASPSPKPEANTEQGEQEADVARTPILVFADEQVFWDMWR